MSEFPAYQSAPQYSRPVGHSAASLRIMSVVAVVFLTITVLLNSASSLSHTLNLGSGSAGVLAGVALISYLAAGIAFVTWLHRARLNLDAFGVGELRWSPGWTVGAWFVPVANLVIPLLVVNEVDKATAVRASAVTESGIGWGARDAGRPLFVVWAVLWTVNTFAGYSALALSSSSYAAAGVVLSVVIEVAAGIAAILLVLRITASQELVRRSHPTTATPAAAAAPVAWPEPGV
jgi:Domain of unknown function (DUF4328)